VVAEQELGVHARHTDRKVVAPKFPKTADLGLPDLRFNIRKQNFQRVPRSTWRTVHSPVPAEYQLALLIAQIPKVLNRMSQLDSQDLQRYLVDADFSSHLPNVRFGVGCGVFNLYRFHPVLYSWDVRFLFPAGRSAFFGVRWLDAALAVPFFLFAPGTVIVQKAKLTQNQSGVKPPHSKIQNWPVKFLSSFPAFGLPSPRPILKSEPPNPE
jgi:hypothetical protein